MELNEQNYYSQEADIEYMSFSQLKSFMECEAKAMAKIRGELPPEMDIKSESIVQSAYVDTYFAGELDAFIEQHPEMFSSRGATKGELKSNYQLMNEVIKSIECDEAYKNFFYSGKRQVIVTGEIGGVLFKGKLDFLNDDYIVDAKTMASLDPIWNDREKRKMPFYEFYGYDMQGAIYRELARQTFGKQFKYYLAPVTKEKYPRKEAYRFADSYLDETLERVVELAQKYQKIKTGEVEPERCGCCNYCKNTYRFNVFDIKDVTKHE